MSVIVTYDLDSGWTEVKTAAIEAGFSNFVPSNAGTRIELPNTTLRIEGLSIEQARDKFVAIVRSLRGSIRIERFAAFDWMNMTSHSDPSSLTNLGSLLGQRM